MNVNLKSNSKTVMSSLKFMVVLGQIFGLTPVSGVSSNDPANLKFTWKSWITLNAVISIICIIFFIIIGTAHLIIFGYYLPRIGKYT